MPARKKKVTDVRFVGIGGFWDETEFDTWEHDELALCWFDFCIENRIITELFRDEIYEEPDGFEHVSAQGDPIVERVYGNVIVRRAQDYAVGHIYDARTGTWSWGHYGFENLDDARKCLIRCCLDDLEAGRSFSGEGV